jgi:lysozyme family protein
VQYPSEFLTAVERVLADEGGYVCNPSDPGGETNFGITKRSYPDLDIKGLTREDAIAIYWRDWWTKYGFDRLSLASPRSSLIWR